MFSINWAIANRCTEVQDTCINPIIIVVTILLKFSDLCLRHSPGAGLLPFVPSKTLYILCSTRGISFHSIRSRPPCSPFREMVHSRLYAYLQLNLLKSSTILAVCLKLRVLGVCQTCVVQRRHIPLSSEYSPCGRVLSGVLRNSHPSHSHNGTFPWPPLGLADWNSLVLFKSKYRSLWYTRWQFTLYWNSKGSARKKIFYNI